MSKIITACLVVAGAVAFALVANAGLDRHERHECIVWQEQAREYRGYYVTKWQAEQCEAHEMPVSITSWER